MALELSAEQLALSSAKLPFEEQIAFFRGKLGRLVPTRVWTDLKKSGHDRGFMVAGAMKADLLSDLAMAVDEVASQGKSIAWFRKAFDSIVDEHGWSYRGERNWRTRVIYQTNLSTSYAAGRLAQLRSPALRRLKPYWMYKHSDSVLHPRPLHVAWDGLTLPADHPWFQAHYPPNGWGCKCYVVAVSRKQAERLGGRVTDTPPDDGTYTKDGEQIPKGIDYGWNYMPGDTWAQPLAEKLATLPPEIGVAFGAAISDAVRKAYSEWIEDVLSNRRVSGRSAALMAMGESELAFLKNKGRAPLRTDVSVEDRLIVGRKAERHAVSGDALTDEEWRALPDQISAKLEAILFDNVTGHVLYVMPAITDGRRIKVVVEPDYWDSRQKTTLTSARATFKVGVLALQDKRRYTTIWGSVE